MNAAVDQPADYIVVPVRDRLVVCLMSQRDVDPTKGAWVDDAPNEAAVKHVRDKMIRMTVEKRSKFVHGLAHRNPKMMAAAMIAFREELLIRNAAYRKEQKMNDVVLKLLKKTYDKGSAKTKRQAFAAETRFKKAMWKSMRGIMHDKDYIAHYVLMGRARTDATDRCIQLMAKVTG